MELVNAEKNVNLIIIYNLLFMKMLLIETIS